MEMMYASLLLNKLGQPINEENLKKVLTAAGAQADEARIKAVVAALEGANIEEVIEKASAMAVAAPAAAPAAAGAPTKDKKEEKVDEKKSEEEAAAGLGALFG